VLALAFSLGIALSTACREYFFSALAVAVLLLILASFLALRRNRLTLSLALALAAISVSGLLMGLAVRDAFPESDLRNHIARHTLRLNEPVASEGCVVRESEMRGEESITTVELLAFRHEDRWIVSKGKAIVRVPGAEPDDPPGHPFKLRRGDRVRGWATWNVPRNYENPGSADNAGLLSRRGVFLIGRVKSLRLLETIPGGCADPWTQIANLTATRVQKSLEPLKTRGREQSAAILASLVIGDYSGLNNSTREAFQNSGTFHVLVISGLHVAWIAGLFLQFLKLIRLSERVRYLLAFALILLYTCVVGFQASITRCLWMFLLYLIGRMIFRQAEAVNILLGSALILLTARPTWLFEAGFQLSFISVLAIALTAAPAMHKYLNPICRPLLYSGKVDRLFLESGRYHRWGRILRVRCEIFIEEITDPLSPSIARFLLPFCRGIAGTGFAIGSLILTSLCVQIWLQPLLACYFNRISWISPLANLVIVPLSSIVLGAGIAGAFTAGLPFLGPAAINIAGSLASFLLSCADHITAFPGAWQRCPTPSPAWVVAGILLLLAWSFLELRRFWIPCTGIAVLLACVSCGSVPGLSIVMERLRNIFQSKDAKTWQREAPLLSITFLDVGEGDSMVLRFPDRRVWVLDAGGVRQTPSQEEGVHGFDVGEAVVSRYLWHFWVNRIDRLMLSHPDLDHAGGIPAVLKNFPVGIFNCSRAGPDRILTAILGAAQERRIRTQPLHVGMEENIGPVTVRVLNPPDPALFNSTNENSLVLELIFKRFSALLTGDLEKAGETEVLYRSGLGRCLLLKVAHHGSRNGTADAFLDRTQSRWAVISVGRNNPFGHPSKETLARLLQHHARPISTMEEGAITFETDGIHYVLKSHLSGILERGEL
jgi:competence protein ComEC